ncbi:OmpA family protein [Belnapia sp. T6]|uniref:OmpA family protein n=2 Tax=Belnapia mucosa TaxID=2804532 RepID=A0ABS1V6H2_9PROT|nr:OmpA family protein [Belnapia mucosa]
MALRTLALVGAISLLAPPRADAQFAPATNPSMQDLIEQLQPTTRGIRMPGQAPAAPAPEQPARAAAGTTAPPGMPAASLRVLFASGSASLTPAAEQSLDSLGRALSSQQLAPYRFRIEGHTDTVGSQSLNQALSERRAMAVRDYLANRHGIDPSRLEAVGMGEGQLLVATPDDTAEARNRRVQVINLGS